MYFYLLMNKDFIIIISVRVINYRPLVSEYVNSTCCLPTYLKTNCALRPHCKYANSTTFLKTIFLSHKMSQMSLTSPWIIKQTIVFMLRSSVFSFFCFFFSKKKRSCEWPGIPKLQIKIWGRGGGKQNLATT